MLSKERGQYFQEQYDKLEYQFANYELNKKCEQLQRENQQLKKQKDDVVELIKARIKENEGHINARMEIYHYKNMLRMLGETNE